MPAGLHARMSPVSLSTLAQVHLVVDLLSAPAWVLDEFPDAKSADADGRTYPSLSWYHAQANGLAQDFVRALTAHMYVRFRRCVTHIQPTYNNQYAVGRRENGGEGRRGGVRCGCARLGAKGWGSPTGASAL